MVILSFIAYFILTFTYGMLLGEGYFGFNPFFPQLLVLGIYCSIAVALMLIVIYAREKWIGVEDFNPEKTDSNLKNEKKN